MTLRSRRIVTAATAATFGAADVLHKLATHGSLLHYRSPAAVALMVVVLAALVWLVPLVPWTPVAVGAGIAAGGALATVVSIAVWGAVPNPLVVHVADGGVAFNLADVFIVGGDALLLAASAVYALRHRDQLRLPL